MFGRDSLPPMAAMVVESGRYSASLPAHLAELEYSRISRRKIHMIPPVEIVQTHAKQIKTLGNLNSMHAAAAAGRSKDLLQGNTKGLHFVHRSRARKSRLMTEAL